MFPTPLAQDPGQVTIATKFGVSEEDVVSMNRRLGGDAVRDLLKARFAAYEEDDELEEEDDFLRELARVEDMVPPSRQPLAGQTLGRFRILSELGRGGMGIVYRALDSKLGRAVAIKVLRDQFSEDPEFLERFRREGKLHATRTPGFTVAALEKLLEEHDRIAPPQRERAAVGDGAGAPAGCRSGN